MALRDELLGIKGIGPTLADKIVEVVDAEAEKARAAMDEAIEDVERFLDDKLRPLSTVPTPLVTALRAAKTGCNPPNGCPLCGVDGCFERCPAWGV